MDAARIVISGLRGGAGKTLLSLGLARALSRSGLRVKPYKKGPDYIDAAWLAQAAACPCTNLDPFFLEGARLRALLGETLPSGSLALIEGNRGLFDGRDVEGSCSTAELARVLEAPVLLSLDCTKMTRTAAALVAGVLSFEEGVRLAGVVLNQVASERHASIVRRSIERYTGLPVLGALPRLRHNPLPERHMGLAGGTEEAGDILERLADLVHAHVDTARVAALAQTAAPLPAEEAFWRDCPVCLPDGQRPRIGYVRDSSLWFYYAENLEALQRAGAELLQLSLRGGEAWPELDGLYLGGGFPEEHAGELAESPVLAQLRQFSAAGMPIYAECGGFMVLARAIVREGREYPMAGIFPVTAHFTPFPQGLGYVEASVAEENVFHPRGTLLRGHEFHYSRCIPDSRADLRYALTLERGVGMGAGRDGLLTKRTFASYMHCYAPVMPHWAQRFVAAACWYRNERSGTQKMPF